MERTRKDALAAAAVTVLADRGSRGLTHRAVDAVRLGDPRGVDTLARLCGQVDCHFGRTALAAVH
ncbi:MAG: hypothetical protein WBB00_09265 [Mycobacterium sp.]